MNKILLITLLLSQANFAQSIFPTDGNNVGIGTLNPTSNLEIRETISTSVPAGQIAPTKSILKFSRNGTFGYSYNENAEFRLGHGGNSVYGSKLDLYINGNSNTNSIPDQHVMTWNYNGNVGIGNTNPLDKLDISGNLILRNYENIAGKGNIITFTAYGSDLQGPQIRSYLTYAAGADSRMGLMLSSYSSGYKDELFLIDGNVGIGTKSPTNKLDVNGTIHSKEVKVDMIGWSDFVFKKEYNLPTLQEVEKHINEKGHLENIPNEKEVLKSGINLGEMNAKLLQKIEELTLYMIDQNKNIQGLIEENKKQNEEIMTLKKSTLSK